MSPSIDRAINVGASRLDKHSSRRAITEAIGAVILLATIFMIGGCTTAGRLPATPLDASEQKGELAQASSTQADNATEMAAAAEAPGEAVTYTQRFAPLIERELLGKPELLLAADESIRQAWNPYWRLSGRGRAVITALIDAHEIQLRLDSNDVGDLCATSQGEPMCFFVEDLVQAELDQGEAREVANQAFKQIRDSMWDDVQRRRLNVVMTPDADQSLAGAWSADIYLDNAKAAEAAGEVADAVHSLTSAYLAGHWNGAVLRKLGLLEAGRHRPAAAASWLRAYAATGPPPESLQSTERLIKLLDNDAMRVGDVLLSVAKDTIAQLSPELLDPRAGGVAPPNSVGNDVQRTAMLSKVVLWTTHVGDFATASKYAAMMNRDNLHDANRTAIAAYISARLDQREELVAKQRLEKQPESLKSAIITDLLHQYESAADYLAADSVLRITGQSRHGMTPVRTLAPRILPDEILSEFWGDVALSISYDAADAIKSANAKETLYERVTELLDLALFFDWRAQLSQSESRLTRLRQVRELSQQLANAQASTKVADVVRILKDYPWAANVLDKNGLNALHRATMAGDTEFVKQLLAHGADVNAATSAGERAIHLAAQSKKSAPSLNVLLENGAEPNHQDLRGRTALHVALLSLRGAAEVDAVRALVKEGGNLFIADDAGITPIDLANESAPDIAGIVNEIPSTLSPFIGELAPPFTLSELDESAKTISDQDLRGHVWVLHVWSSWCPSCREEIPLLEEFAKRNSVPLYGLNFKDERTAALSFLARFGNPYVKSMFDAEGRTGIDFGVTGVPETYVIDKAGTIRMSHIGPLTPTIIETKLLPLVKEFQSFFFGVFEGRHVHLDPTHVLEIGPWIVSVERTGNEHAMPSIGVYFDDKGKEIIARFSERLLGQEVGFLVNGELISVAVVQTPLLNGSVVISGSANLQGAEQLLKQFLAERSDSESEELGAIETDVKTGNYSAAQSKVTAYIRNNPKHFGAIILRASIFVMMGEYDQAIADLDTVLTSDTKLSVAYAIRGFAKFATGRFEDARTDFDEESQMEKNDAIVGLLNYLAQIRSGHNDVVEIKLPPMDEVKGLAKWRASLIDLYLGHASPRDVINAVVTQSEDSCEASYFVAQWYLVHNNQREAVTLFRKSQSECSKFSGPYAAAASAELSRIKDR